MKKIVCSLFFQLFIFLSIQSFAQTEMSIDDDASQKKSVNSKKRTRFGHMFGYKKLPDDLSIWKNATNFSLSGTHEMNDDNFFKEIFQLKKLQKLNLSAPEITFIPSEIENLKNLETLILKVHKVKEFPTPEIANLKHVRRIYYVGIGLRTLTPAIRQMSNLDTLTLRTAYFCSF